MTTEAKGQPYLKGRFTGLFKQKNKKYQGNFIFSKIYWTHLKIEDCEKIENFDAQSQKTDDYWFSKKIYSTLTRNPFRKKTDVFIPHGTEEKFSGNLYNVLIKNVKFNIEKSYFLQKDWHEASGDIYFQLSLPPKPKPKKPEPPNTVSGTNVIENPIEKPIEPAHLMERNTGVINLNDNLHLQTNSSATNQNYGENIQTSPPVSPINTNVQPGNWAKWLGILFALLFYGFIGYYLWNHFRTIAYIFLFIVLLNIIGQIFNRFGFLKVFATLAIIGFIGYFLYANYKGIGPDDFDPVKTRDGKVKILPPKPEKKGDVSIEKNIEWYDFIDQSYAAKYKTSEKSFENSVQKQNELKNLLSNSSSSSSVEFYTRFYYGLYNMDDEKITQIAKIFSDSAVQKKMNPLQTAEMVVTFIQEIPYYLVHDESCQKSMEGGNSFLIQYHQEGKPCLPNVAGGVQSPYEFFHNLKGDCDTRSLLGYAILSKLNISSSVWVSEIYGHSILGVAVPVGHGMYKEINGVKHYGVELTAKGYRLGMVSPDQRSPNNWDITLYSNHS